MVTKVIELRDIYDNVLLPYAHAATRDGDNNVITSTYATIQTVNTKQDIITGAASSVTSSDLDPSKVVISNISGKIATSPITSTELGYLSGATENIPTAINTIKDMLIPEDASAGDALIINDDKTALVPGGSIYHPALLSYQPSDHLLNDVQWLRADTFSWQSGNAYTTVYNHLVNDITEKPLQAFCTPNVQMFGNVTSDNNCVLKGFSGTLSYAVINGVYTPSSSFEVVLKVHTPSTYADTQNILGCPTGDYHGMLLRITTSTNISVWMSSNGSSWNIANNKTNVCNIPPNTDVWLKVNWNGTIYDISTSTDGIEYTSIGTISSTLPLYLSDKKMMLGGYNWADRAFVGGAIDLKECYIKINEQFVWKGVKSLSYYEADDKHRICLADQESILEDMYTKYGSAWYYVLDQENTRFKLPRRKNHGDIVEKWNNGSNWYKLYSDGWVEQGGQASVANANSWTTVNLLIPMRDTNYFISDSLFSDTAYWANQQPLYVGQRSLTSFLARCNQNTSFVMWEVKGYSSRPISDTKNRYLYFYVGEFAQSAIQETAGITVEVLNDKLDIDLGNCKYPKFDAIIDWQEPTADNGYTWYRLYKSGWVEQGGADNRTTTGNSGAYNFTIDLPITMSDNRYTVFSNSDFNGGSAWYPPAKRGSSSTTQVVIGGWVNGSSTITLTSWEVKGFAAR